MFWVIVGKQACFFMILSCVKFSKMQWLKEGVGYSKYSKDKCYKPYSSKLDADLAFYCVIWILSPI